MDTRVDMVQEGMVNARRHRSFTRGCRCAVLVVAAIVGCKGDGLMTVSGTVTCDGEPIEDGSISFMPVSGRGVTGGSMIVNGRYSARLSPGEMAVQIDAFRIVRKEKPTQEEIDRGLDVDRISIIPARYNRQSELRATIDASGSRLDFEVKSEE